MKKREKSLTGSTRVAFRFDAETLARLDALASARKTSRSVALRWLIFLHSDDPAPAAKSSS